MSSPPPPAMASTVPATSATSVRSANLPESWLDHGGGSYHALVPGSGAHGTAARFAAAV